MAAKVNYNIDLVYWNEHYYVTRNGFKVVKRDAIFPADTNFTLLYDDFSDMYVGGIGIIKNMPSSYIVIRGFEDSAYLKHNIAQITFVHQTRKTIVLYSNSGYSFIVPQIAQYIFNPVYSSDLLVNWYLFNTNTRAVEPRINSLYMLPFSDVIEFLEKRIYAKKKYSKQHSRLTYFLSANKNIENMLAFTISNIIANSSKNAQKVQINWVARSILYNCINDDELLDVPLGIIEDNTIFIDEINTLDNIKVRTCLHSPSVRLYAMIDKYKLDEFIQLVVEATNVRSVRKSTSLHYYELDMPGIPNVDKFIKLTLASRQIIIAALDKDDNVIFIFIIDKNKPSVDYYDVNKNAALSYILRALRMHINDNDLVALSNATNNTVNIMKILMEA